MAIFWNSFWYFSSSTCQQERGKTESFDIFSRLEWRVEDKQFFKTSCMINEGQDSTDNGGVGAIGVKSSHMAPDQPYPFYWKPPPQQMNRISAVGPDFGLTKCSATAWTATPNTLIAIPVRSSYKASNTTLSTWPSASCTREVRLLSAQPVLHFQFFG